MSNSLHRRRSAGLPRPVITPVRRPAVTANESPCPSCASNVFTSRAWLSGVDARVTLPSVSVPSTSINSTEICLALFATFAGIFIPSPRSFLLPVLCDLCVKSFLKPLHQFQRPQIVQMHNAKHAPRLIHHHDGSDLLLLHQVERLGRQHIRPDSLRILRHAVRGVHFQRSEERRVGKECT